MPVRSRRNGFSWARGGAASASATIEELLCAGLRFADGGPFTMLCPRCCWPGTGLTTDLIGCALVFPWLATVGRLAVDDRPPSRYLAMVGACPLALSLASDPAGRPGDGHARQHIGCHPPQWLAEAAFRW